MKDNAELDRIVLALLFSSDEPLSIKRISQLLEIDPAEVKGSMSRLTTKLDEDQFCAQLEQVALGYQLSTRPAFAKYIARLYSGKRKQRLSKAGLETLAIIAYKQPITRAEIENIRGVSCGGVITTLMERFLIRITGKAKVLGAPFLYGTTQEFLEYLGLNSLKDLPSLEELETLLEQEEYKAEETPETVFSEDENTSPEIPEDSEPAFDFSSASGDPESEDVSQGKQNSAEIFSKARQIEETKYPFENSENDVLRHTEEILKGNDDQKDEPDETVP